MEACKKHPGVYLSPRMDEVNLQRLIVSLDSSGGPEEKETGSMYSEWVPPTLLAY